MAANCACGWRPAASRSNRDGSRIHGPGTRSSGSGGRPARARGRRPLYPVDRIEAAIGRGTERAGTGESRSEEHTSELQSLMRISYAVFCLKKKTNKTNIIGTQ